ncbi:MAG: MBL fold metallo-hydrolase [Eubacterium sp.]|nr:MBL fold metallo-hydrolase [Eubacterium sp.]
MNKLEIKSLLLGNIMTNCYLLMNKETHEMLIVDPADQAFGIQKRVEAMEAKPVAILLTHGHFDHMLAADELRRKYNCEIYAHVKEKAVLEDPMLNLSGVWEAGTAVSADRYVTEGEQLELAGFRIQVLFTPGHTQGSCCYYFPDEGVLISGDTLFQGSCGRTDFPTSSVQDMMKSLKRLTDELPDETAVYPGHNAPTTIADEKRWNPFIPR